MEIKKNCKDFLRSGTMVEKIQKINNDKADFKNPPYYKKRKKKNNFDEIFKKSVDKLKKS
jgi:hypothetical protein